MFISAMPRMWFLASPLLFLPASAQPKWSAQATDASAPEHKLPVVTQRVTHPLAGSSAGDAGMWTVFA